MTAKQNIQRQAKRTTKKLTVATDALKTGTRRQVKRAVEQVSEWSTAKKIGVATVVAVPIIAAAITGAVVWSRKPATGSKTVRRNSNAR